MTPADFVKRRKANWDALEQIIYTAGRIKRSQAAPAELSRFAGLYRSVCADLARARAQGFPDDLVDYLNSLAARSHNAFYVAPPARLARFFDFFRVTFPATVHRNIRYVVAGLLFFYLPLFGMVALSKVNPEMLYELIPKATLESMEKMHSKGHAQGRSESTDAAMTGFYVKNNVGIAFQCFAMGVFFGLGSIIVLLFNGTVIGAVFGFVSGTGSGMNLISFAVAHGPFELTAIGLAGAAGLRLGLGAVITGSRRRRDSLILAGRDAIRLVLGAGAMLIIAALIEGFLSPSALPAVIKFTFGAITLLFLIWYLGVYGWRRGQLIEQRRATQVFGEGRS